jgi:hypothetical protein
MATQQVIPETVWSAGAQINNKMALKLSTIDVIEE